MKIKKSRSRIAFEIVNYTILALLALMCIFPFVHLLAVSFSADEFTSKGEVFLIPQGFTLQAYEYLAQKKEFFTALGISVLRTVIGTALSLVVIVMTAYPLSKTGWAVQGKNRFHVVLPHHHVFRRPGCLQPISCTNNWDCSTVSSCTFCREPATCGSSS